MPSDWKVKLPEESERKQSLSHANGNTVLNCCSLGMPSLKVKPSLNIAANAVETLLQQSYDVTPALPTGV